MKCVICKHGETVAGSATITIVRGALTMVIKQTPAIVCENCGEEYIEDDIAAELFNAAESVAKSGAELDVRHFLKAA